MESIDDLLAQIKSEYQQKDNPEQQKKQPPAKREKAIEPQLPKLPPPTSGRKSFSTSSPEDALL
ncbi:MAG TPA: hypothetical protein VIQ31_01980, partial [Phormidium sp.]